MRRRSRLTVLIRLARLEESNALRAFGETRAALAEIDARLESHRGLLGDADRSRWGASARSPHEIRAAICHAAHLSEKLALLGLEQQEARRKLATAREALAAAQLRVRAFEDADGRRQARELRREQKRELRKLDDAHRASMARAGGGQHAPR